MNDELEKSLRAALRPEDPGEKFTRSVLARIVTEPVARSAYPRHSRPLFRWASAALGLLVTAGLFMAHHWQVHRTQQGLEARRQLLEALQITGKSLDTAYRMINTPTP